MLPTCLAIPGFIWVQKQFMMDDLNQKALSSFRGGMNCAQAVLITFTDSLGVDTGSALAISSGFGGGMGHLQETCGAVTGAFMVLGIYTTRKYTDSDERKAHTNALIQEFNHRFTAIHKTSICGMLLGTDLKTEEGRQTMQDNNLSEIVCAKCVSDSVKILQDLLK